MELLLTINLPLRWSGALGWAAQILLLLAIMISIG
jgi:hypothetical protein